MLSGEEEEECFFKCGNPGKTDKCTSKRIESIISASKLRKDAYHESLEQCFTSNPNLVVHCHRTCVSTYTSKTHISRALKRSLPKEECFPQCKRVLRSEPEPFNFRRNCFLCGEECVDRDPKNPCRYNPYFFVRTVEFKTGILDVCNKRHDKWAEEVQLRVSGATSDLHAADAMYHWKCHKLFTSDRNMKAAKNKSSDELKDDDIVFNEVTQEMVENSAQTWNSVELHSFYLSFGGSTLSRRTFVQKLQDHFGKELLVLSSPGIASLVLFRQHCTTTLISTENDEDIVSEYVKPLASMIRKETLKADKSNYHVKIDTSTVRRECSETLMHLLNELKIPNLAALAIGSIVASSLKKAPVQLQVAFSNLLKKKSLIEELSHFMITTTYDEFKRFRASVAKACSANLSLRGIHEGKGLIQVVGDNFDAAICSENGLRQTHAMGMILTKCQQDIVNTEQEVMTITRISKNEVTVSPEPDVTIERYKGPKKVPMPSLSLPMEGIPPLKVLASEVVKQSSVVSAQRLDFNFLKLVAQSPDTPEYNGFNTKLHRESIHDLGNATKVMYLPLIDLPPTDHDTVLTSMLEAQRLTNECGQPFVVFTADQAIYKVVVDIIWNDPEKFSNFVPRLGGMHILMSFIGCIGSLMAGSGMAEILECAFAGVLKMLKGKKFPQNMRALRLLAEEVLRPVLEDNAIINFETMIENLDEKCTHSRTTRMWVYNFIKPVLLTMSYVRAEREADWFLHLWCVQEMLPYFAAAGHWNYLRYASVYVMHMKQMPRDCLNLFLKGEHVMRHRSGYWNGIWSDMMIESTFMRYGHGERGNSLTGLTLNTAGVKRWALSMHVTSQLASELCKMREHREPDTIHVHKEESNRRISRDAVDRDKLRKKLELCIQPLNPSEHPQGLVNIVSGKVVSAKAINVDKAYEMAKVIVHKFQESLPSGFHDSLKKFVVFMSEDKEGGKIKTAMQMDPSLLYSKIVALQANRDIKMTDVLKYELASVPPSMFKDDGNMREAVGKSVLMNTMSVSQSARRSNPPSLIIIDGCALLWVVHWPVGGSVSDFLKNFLEIIIEKLKYAHVNLVFDRYYDYSIKSATRASRGKKVSRKFILNETTPLPPQNITLSNNDNKRQLIQLLCNYISEHVCNVPCDNRLVVTGQDVTPVQIHRGNLTHRTDLKTEHEEADIIMIQQLIAEVTGKESETVHVMCDDTDVFVLLLYYYHQLEMKNEVFMVSLKPGRSSVYIKDTVSKYKDIITSLPAAHALSGCDSVAPIHGIGKKTVIKCLQAGKQLRKLGHKGSCMAEIIDECTTFIASCYGIEGAIDMTEVRISLWAKKIGQAQLRAPSFASLPPTKECFAENVKRAHLQSILWLSANSPLSLVPDPTSLGWQKDEANKELLPIAIPENIPIAPDYIIAMTKCSCRSDQPCITMRCSCRANNISCSLMCQCLHEGEKCCNPTTKIAQSLNDSDSEDEF